MGLNPRKRKSDNMTDETTVDAEVIDSPAIDTPVDTEVAPSAASEDNHEEKSNGFQERINEVTRQKYEEKAKADQAAREAEQFKRELEELKAKSQMTQISAPSDDLMYENLDAYKQQQAEYAQQQVRQALREEKEVEQARQGQMQEQQQQQEQAQARDKRFTESAQKDGLDAQDAFNAARTVGTLPIAQDVIDAILSHDNQAAIIKHLSNNIAEVEALNQSSGNVFNLVNSVTKLAEKALTKKMSSAPEPVPNLGQSSGISEPDDFGGMFKNSRIT